jgi:hypothetical protein
MGTKVKHLIEALLRHGNMETPVRILDQHGRPREIAVRSGTNIVGIHLRAHTPVKRQPKAG